MVIIFISSFTDNYEEVLSKFQIRFKAPLAGGTSHPVF